MKNYYLILLSIIILLSFFSGCIENKQTPLQKQYINMDHEQFTRALFPPEGSTELQKQDFYNSLNRFNGQYVKWRLQIEDVTKDSIILHTGAFNEYKVILFIAEDQKSELLSLKKDEYITVEGIPDYKNANTVHVPGSNVYGLLRIKLNDGRIISESDSNKPVITPSAD